MLVSKKKYDELYRINQDLNQRCLELEREVENFKEDNGETMLKSLKTLAKECNIDTHGEEYQTFMSRMFMAVAGRTSPEAKAYSKMAFVKDNPQELLERAAQLIKQASVITRELEHDKKKK